MSPSYLNARQVAVRYGVTRQTVYNLVKRGELPPAEHLGRAARWSVAALEAVDQRRAQISPAL